MKEKIRVWFGKIGLLMMLFCFIFLNCPQNTYAKTEDPIGDAKNGIVEVFSGFSNREGTFLSMKSGSGFLISNTEGTTYIVTNNSIVQNSSEEKTAYCEANGIDTENFGMTDAIRIVVKGDVTIDASVLAQSEDMDFCILSTENVVNEKTALKLGDSKALVTGDVIYALGFPKNIDSLEFQASDVEIFQGNIQDKESNQSGVQYIQHSAVVSAGNTGGPILDAEGYVVGINCTEHSNPTSGRYYSLPINELIEVLDNFAINYGSRKKDDLRKDLDALQQECVQLNESGSYKKDSLTALQTVLSDAEKLSETQDPTVADMEDLYQQLIQAKDAVVPKMEKIQIAIYVLAVLIVILLLVLMWIFILNGKDKKKEIVVEDATGDLERETQRSTNKKMQNDFDTEKTVGQKSSEIIDDDEEKTVGLSSYRRNYSASQDKKDAFLQRTTELEIVRRYNGQAVKMNKPEYMIGKNPNQSDLSVPDNKAVSRKHAEITWKSNEYYICDLGSVNGTYVKEKKIPEGIPVKLNNGDILRLADEEFLIKISDV